jgi:hypothetical protein
MKPEDQSPVRKKRYSPPQLQVYGNLREITKAVAHDPTAILDGGAFPASRTH